MSYAVYKTEAIVARTVPQGEANVDAVFLTRDLGKVTARVQAGRKAESKMRMHLARYGTVSLDLVRGVSVWRVTGVSSIGGLSAFDDESFLKVWHRVFGLAEFLIRGEEPHRELFDFFAEFLGAAHQGHAQEGLELFGVINVLDLLGYWSGERLPHAPTPDLLESLVANRKELVRMINESLEATQIVV